jgi:hypothetical protein
VEIDQVIKGVPSERDPGPDGFNVMFFKKCWHIIKHDFFQLCHDFHNGAINLQACFPTQLGSQNADKASLKKITSSDPTTHS